MEFDGAELMKNAEKWEPVQLNLLDYAKMAIEEENEKREKMVSELFEMRKRKLEKLKLIGLYHIQKPVLTNISRLTIIEKGKFMKVLEDYNQNKSDAEIDNEFNLICQSEVFSGFDYTEQF